MKKIISLILNLPWSIVGIALAVISLPIKINSFESQFFTIVIKVKRVWVIEIFYKGRIKGVALGNIVLLSDVAESSTIKHELVHSKQFINYPFIFMFMYYIEIARHGYQNNIFEIEARNF